MIRRSNLPSNILRGALFGTLLGGALLGVGLVRFAFFLLSGGRGAAVTPDDVRMAAVYVGSFALGGALVGALRDRLRGAVGTYAAGSIIGIIVMCGIAIGDQGLAKMDLGDWIAMPLFGILFGCAGAYGWRRSSSGRSG